MIFCKNSAAEGIALIRCDSRFRFSVSPNTPSGRSGLKTTSCRFYRKIAHRFVDESNGSPSRNRCYFAERHPLPHLYVSMFRFDKWSRQWRGGILNNRKVALDLNLIIRRRSDEGYPVKSTRKLILAPMRRMTQFGVAGEANREARRILVKIYSNRFYSVSLPNHNILEVRSYVGHEDATAQRFLL